MSSPTGVDAPGGEVSCFDQLGESPLVLRRQQVDLADLAQVHAHTVRRRAVAAALDPRRPAAPAPAEQSFVGRVVGELLERQGDNCGGRHVIAVIVAFVDRLVDADTGAGQRLPRGFEDITGQFDVAQNEGDLLGMDRLRWPARVR